MFFPIGDEPNPRGTPLITYLLIGLNVVVWVFISLPQNVQPADPLSPFMTDYLDVIRDTLPSGTTVDQVAQRISAYDLFVFEYGYRPADPSVLTLFTSMFLHGSWMHLLGNMLFLWIYGDNVEHRLGAIAFLVWYLVTGAAATLFHAMFAADSPVPLVGASGAISGVLGFYFVWFPHNRVRVLVFLFIIIRVMVLPARVVLGFYIVVSNILPFIASSAQGGGVAYGAHIGGFLAGGAVALFMNRRELTSRPREYRGAHDGASSKDTIGQTISNLIRGGSYPEAAQMYFDVPAASTKRLLEPTQALALGHWLSSNGHERAALTVYQRQLRDFPNGSVAAEAHALAGLLQLHAFREPTAAYQHLVEALDYDLAPELERTVRAALSEIATLQKFPVGRYGAH